MLGIVRVLIQALSLVTFTYIGLALNRRMVKSSNLASLKRNVVMYLCVCPYVSNCMKRICTFVKLQCILDIFIILLLSYYGEFSRGTAYVIKFCQDIFKILRGSSKQVYSYFGGLKHLDCYYYVIT